MIGLIKEPLKIKEYENSPYIRHHRTGWFLSCRISLAKRLRSTRYPPSFFLIQYRTYRTFVF
nr:MAG TPA: hypothetical protein [Caudoviricetes sp.]